MLVGSGEVLVIPVHTNNHFFFTTYVPLFCIFCQPVAHTAGRGFWLLPAM